jgi:hypothetical protein
VLAARAEPFTRPASAVELLNPADIIGCVSQRRVNARIVEDPSGWSGRIDDPPVEVRARTRSECVRKLERALGEGVSLTVQVEPEVVGVAEAAAIMGWDKRRVITYLRRGAFPAPFATLASGRVWRRDDIERFAADRRRRAKRKSGR